MKIMNKKKFFSCFKRNFKVTEQIPGKVKPIESRALP